MPNSLLINPSLWNISRDHNLPKHCSSYVDYLQQVWSCLPQVTTKQALFHFNLLKEEYNCRQCIFYCYGLNMSSAVKWFIASYKPPPLFHCFMGFIEHSSFLCVCFYFRHFISWYRVRLKACLLWYTTNVELDWML